MLQKKFKYQRKNIQNELECKINISVVEIYHGRPKLRINCLVHPLETR